MITFGVNVFLYQKYEGDGESSGLSMDFKHDYKQKSSTDKYEELKKAKELLDEGILTEEEYIKEKNLILGKEK